jgi:4-amino-4-deoxy-L-arabinose transferase-like glycosyltransferase
MIEKYLKIKKVELSKVELSTETKISIALVLFLTICGFLLRIYHLGVPSFWMDEAISSNVAVALVKQGTPSFLSGVIYMRSILNTFFISLSFRIFDISEFSARFPSVIFGTLTIPLVYLIGAKLGNRKLALIAALFITFSVMEITWSRQARMYQQLQFFYLVSLYFFYEFNSNYQARKNKSKRNLYLALTILSVTAAVLSHEFGYLLIPVLVSWFFIVNFKEIKNNWKDLGYISGIVGFFIFMIFLIFLISKFMKLDIFMIISNILLNNRMGSIDYLEAYLYILTDNLSIFFYLAIIGAIFFLKKDWISASLLIIGFVIPFYIISYYINIPGTRYLYFIFPILLIFSSYFFVFMIDLAQEYSENRSAKIGSIIFACVVCSMLLIMLSSSQVFMISPQENLDTGVNAPRADFKMAYNYIKENMHSNDVIIDTWPAVSLFYMGKSDYWLAFEAFGMGLGTDSLSVNNGSNEIYANASVIYNVDQLKEVVAKFDRGWIVIDNTAWIRISSDIKKYINDQFQLEASDGNIMIYSWGINKSIQPNSSSKRP